MTHIASTLNRAVAALGLAALLFTVATPAAAQSDAASSGPSLVGAWTIQVTLRNCDSGAPLGPPFNSLVTFHQDGTISETAGGLTFAPGQRSPGHGAWNRKPGHNFGQEMISMINFDTAPNLPSLPTFDPTKPISPGFFAGWSTVSHTLRFTGADEIASSGTNAFYKTNGEVYRTGCSTATGQRF